MVCGQCPPYISNKMKFFNDNKPPLRMDDLIGLEHQIGCTLPEDYRSFLILHNGGQPERQILNVQDCESDIIIDIFFGIEKPHADIQFWLNELDDDLKGAFLAIGFDPSSNALLMDKSDGNIYYWDSARHFPCSSDEENAFWVANSFCDLLQKLRE
jgi:SMI1 / KNR4 family (SUKH-1)